MKQNWLVVLLITTILYKLLEKYRAERARVPPAERARVSPVRDKFSRVNARTLSGRLHAGKGRQTSQTTFTDVSEQESLQQVDRLQGKIRSNLFAYLHAAVLSHPKNHLSQGTDAIQLSNSAQLRARIASKESPRHWDTS